MTYYFNNGKLVNSMNLRLSQFKLPQLIGLYVGLFLLYRVLPQSWQQLQTAVSFVLALDLAAIFLVGLRQLGRN